MTEAKKTETPDLTWVRAMIIDMDGVIWRGETILPGVAALFEHLRQHDIRFVLATNNATQTPATYRQRMRGAGVEVAEREVLTSALATAAYLSERLDPGSKLLVVGDRGIRQALTDQGFQITAEADQAEAVVAAMSRAACWDDLAEATLAIRRGVPFIGTNPDSSFPSERGQVPGAGALLAALQAASGREPTVIGKPEPHLYRRATEVLKTAAEETLVLGDRLETDILGGLRLGAPTALLLTGVTDQAAADQSEIKPDFVLRDLDELLQGLNKQGRQSA